MSKSAKKIILLCFLMSVINPAKADWDEWLRKEVYSKWIYGRNESDKYARSIAIPRSNFYISINNYLKAGGEESKLHTLLGYDSGYNSNGINASVANLCFGFIEKLEEFLRSICEYNKKHLPNEEINKSILWLPNLLSGSVGDRYPKKLQERLDEGLCKVFDLKSVANVANVLHKRIYSILMKIVEESFKHKNSEFSLGSINIIERICNKLTNSGYSIELEPVKQRLQKIAIHITNTSADNRARAEVVLSDNEKTNLANANGNHTTHVKPTAKDESARGNNIIETAAKAKNNHKAPASNSKSTRGRRKKQ